MHLAVYKEPILRSDASLSRLMNEIVKKDLNLWTNWGSQSNQVFSVLSADFMKPVVNVGRMKN